MTNWYAVFAPAGTASGWSMSWRVLVVDGRVAAGTNFLHCPAQIGEDWAELVEKWRTWKGWRVEELPALEMPSSRGIDDPPANTVKGK